MRMSRRRTNIHSMRSHVTISLMNFGRTCHSIGPTTKIVIAAGIRSMKSIVMFETMKNNYRVNFPDLFKPKSGDDRLASDDEDPRILTHFPTNHAEKTMHHLPKYTVALEYVILASLWSDILQQQARKLAC
mmetsp:Transcript_11847/g.28426  ORF Transcript_11847/g.28426 Transcript_11847/m.28426 type:complete len:131 (-) Transcript_11847:1131-1523(-)